MSLLAIHEVRDAEEESPELSQDTLGPDEFTHCYHCAAKRADAAALNSFWKGPEGLLSLYLSSDFFRASGSYDASDPLGQLPFSGRWDVGKPQYEIHYQGRITGFTVDGLMEIKAKGRIGKVHARKRVMMHISEDGTTINVCIDAKEKSRKHLHVLRVAAPPVRHSAWAAQQDQFESI